MNVDAEEITRVVYALKFEDDELDEFLRELGNLLDEVSGVAGYGTVRRVESILTAKRKQTPKVYNYRLNPQF